MLTKLSLIAYIRLPPVALRCECDAGIAAFSMSHVSFMEDERAVKGFTNARDGIVSNALTEIGVEITHEPPQSPSTTPTIDKASRVEHCVQIVPEAC